MGTAPIPKQHVRHDFIVHFPSHPFIPLLPSPGQLPCRVLFPSRLIFKGTKTFTDALDTKKKATAKLLVEGELKKTRTVNGLTLRTHSFGCDNQKTFCIWKIVFFLNQVNIC